MGNIAPVGDAVAVDAGFAGHAAQARSGAVRGRGVVFGSCCAGVSAFESSVVLSLSHSSVARTGVSVTGWFCSIDRIGGISGCPVDMRFHTNRRLRLMILPDASLII